MDRIGKLVTTCGLLCSMCSVAIWAEDAPNPTSGVVAPTKKAFNSLEAYKSKTTTPDEDYDAGARAYDMGEMIEAQGLFERAAVKGHSGAQARLAEILDRAEFNAEALHWYRKSAEQGNPEGQYGLAIMYMQGEGTAVDFREARKWFVLAAEQKHEKALSVVIGAYVRGGLGLEDAERTDVEVMKWINKGLDANDPLAFDAMSSAYHLGQFGLSADEEKSAEWAKKANELRGIKEEVKKKARKKRI